MSPRHIVETAVARGLHMIAVSDHNTAQNAGAVMDAGRALVVVVNKWDMIIRQWEKERIEGFRSLKRGTPDYLQTICWFF